MIDLPLENLKLQESHFYLVFFSSMRGQWLMKTQECGNPWWFTSSRTYLQDYLIELRYGHEIKKYVTEMTFEIDIVY